MYKAENTPPLMFKARLEDEITNAILAVCNERPTDYAKEVAKVVVEHPSNYPVSALVTAVERVVWLAESRRWIDRGTT